MTMWPNPPHWNDDPDERVIHVTLTLKEAEALSAAASCIHAAAFMPELVMHYMQDHDDPDMSEANRMTAEQALLAARMANRLDVIRESAMADVTAWVREQAAYMERHFSRRAPDDIPEDEEL